MNMCCGTNCWSLEKNRVNSVQVTSVVSLILKLAVIISLLLHGDIMSNPVQFVTLKKLFWVLSIKVILDLEVQ